MFKRTAVALLAMVVVMLVAACGGGKYSDVKDVMSKMNVSMDKFAASMDSVTDAAGAAKALTDFATEFQGFKSTLEDMDKKYPELKDVQDPPAELKEVYDGLQASSGKMMDAMVKIQAYAEDPAVLEAMSKLQGF